MRTTLKGPLAAFVAYLLLLAATYGGAIEGATDGDPFAVDGGPWALGQWLGDAFDGGDGSAEPATRAVVAMLAFAAAAAAWFALLLAWTGNRVVSFVAGALWCVCPSFGDMLLGGGDALLQVLPALGIALTLLVREQAWNRAREGRPARAHEFMAVGVGLMTMASGPSGLAVGVLLLPVDVIFHHGHRRPDQPRDPVANVLPFAAAVGLGGLVLAPPEGTFGLEGAGVTTFTTTLLVVAGAALLIGFRSLSTAPKWMVLYAGFGAIWYLLCAGAASFGRHSDQVAAMAGLTILPPALVWRFLLVLIPEPGDSRRRAPAPTLDPESLRAGLPPFPELPELAPVAVTPATHFGRPSSAVPFPSAPEVRASVEAAVEAAVAAAASVVSPQAPASRAPGRRYAEEWDRYAEEWQAKRRDRASQLLGEEWSDQDLDRNLFANYCRPFLSTRTRVLEIGQGGGKFTRLIAPEVEHVVCLDVARRMLEGARDGLKGVANVSYVLGDGRGLAPFATGSMDFAFSYDVFVHLDQEDVFLYLQDLKRVLRPAGRAVLSFANLLDPLGFTQFEAEAGRHRTGARAAGRINFLSPDVVRTLATSANLDVESIHLAANNRDMIAILGRPPA
ncbi:MAG: class I SAM-dependent methyltransferase [Planctomycetes bacterium]|nr:class I SAM-dependent methyltransferase [Planctomycetota bacterium]